MSVGRGWEGESKIEKGWCQGCMAATFQVRVSERWEEQGEKGEWKKEAKERRWCLSCERVVREA